MNKQNKKQMSKTSKKEVKPKTPVYRTEKVLMFLKENKKTKFTVSDINKIVFKNKQTNKQILKTIWGLTVVKPRNKKKVATFLIRRISSNHLSI